MASENFRTALAKNILHTEEMTDIIIDIRAVDQWNPVNDE